MKNNLLDILNSYELENEDDKFFCTYQLRSDNEWPWGMTKSFLDAERAVKEYESLADDPATIGIWITVESCDGLVDHTVLKWVKFSKRTPLERRTYEPCNDDYVGKHEKGAN